MVAPFMVQDWQVLRSSDIGGAHFCGTVLKPGTFQVSAVSK
jgi:hypothetical protein